MTRSSRTPGLEYNREHGVALPTLRARFFDGEAGNGRSDKVLPQYPEEPPRSLRQQKLTLACRKDGGHMPVARQVAWQRTLVATRTYAVVSLPRRWGTSQRITDSAARWWRRGTNRLIDSGLALRGTDRYAWRFSTRQTGLDSGRESASPGCTAGVAIARRWSGNRAATRKILSFV